MYYDNYEDQQNQVKEEYYIMGLTDGGDKAPIQFVNEPYLSGYKHGIINSMERSLEDALNHPAYESGNTPF